MAYGYEIVLGWTTDAVARKMAEELGCSFLDEDWDDKLCEECVVPTPVEKLLEEAFHNTAKAMGFQRANAVDKKGNPLPDEKGYCYYITPWGGRKHGIWELQTYYDPDELGDDATTYTLGVNLSSRYVPAILDAKSEHGTLGVVDIEEVHKAALICKEQITKLIPQFESAKIYLKEVHY